MKIDFECHALTAPFLSELKRTGVSFEETGIPGFSYFHDHELRMNVGAFKTDPERIESRIRDMDNYDIDIQVLSVAYQLLSKYEGKTLIDLVRAANDGISDMVSKAPDRFAGLANLPFSDTEASLDELDRATGDLGLKGVILYSSSADDMADLSKSRSVFQKITKYDIPILLHPAFPLPKRDNSINHGSDDLELWPGLLMSKNHDLSVVLGWPFDTSLALAKIVLVSKIFEEFPNLKIVAAHLGGMIPYYRGRIDMLYSQYHPELAPNPSSLLKNIYLDTAIYDPASIMCGYSFAGADKLLFATDYPYGPDDGRVSMKRAIETVEALDIPQRDKERIFSENAKALIRL